MNLFINHDISKVNHTKFIQYTLWQLISTSRVKPSVYLYIHRDNYKIDTDQTQSILKEIYTEINQRFEFQIDNSIITILDDVQQAKNTVYNAVSMHGPLITIESNMLLPKPILYSQANFKHSHNIWLPLITFKHHKKKVKWNNKEYEVKNFVTAKDPYYNSDYVPDWDERYHITHNLLAKLDDAMPTLSPSPLIHNYGNMTRVIRNNVNDGSFNNKSDIIVNKMSLSIHQFEDVSVRFGDEITIGEKCSLERQDEFVYHVLAKHLKTPGRFLDVGCASPIAASNTYVLEKYLNWTGLAFDIGNVEVDENWSQHRTAPFKQIDATSPEMTSYLQSLDNKFFDYISLDVDSHETSYSADALKRIIDADIEFRVLTLEHESFKHGNSITKPTRDLLHSKGYQILFEDVCFEDGNPWEDWWVKPELIPIDNVMQYQKKNITFHNCINNLIHIEHKEQLS